MGVKLKDVTGSAGSYLIKEHNSDPNIERVEDDTYNITVKQDTDQYPVGTVLSVKLDMGKVISITPTGQKANVIPKTYEEWKALPEGEAKRKFAQAFKVDKIREEAIRNQANK